MSKLKNMAAVAGVESFEVQDGGIFLTEEQANAIESILDKNKSALETATAKNNELNTQLAEANEKVAEAEIEKKALVETIKVLKDLPAEETAEVVTESNSVEKKEADVCVSSNSQDFLANVRAVKEAYL
jgi:seryl-tRNA synthetase